MVELRHAGAMLANQCPLIVGVNDDPEVLARLFRKLAAIGAPQYYVFQGRPTAGNRPYELPIVRAYGIFREACTRTSGLGRRARFCMSHSSGKIATVGIDERHMYLRYHRAKDPKHEFRFMTFDRDDGACWLDDLQPSDEATRSVFDSVTDPSRSQSSGS
jgi:L-lysine 2,3-aminomutase